MITFQISMEGEVSELETLDSELVMSFYDQYHTEDLSKVSFLILIMIMIKHHYIFKQRYI